MSQRGRHIRMTGLVTWSFLSQAYSSHCKHLYSTLDVFVMAPVAVAGWVPCRPPKTLTAAHGN